MFLAYLQGKYLFCSAQLQHAGTGDTKPLVEQVEKLKFELSNAKKEATSYRDIAQQYTSLLEQYNVKDNVKSTSDSNIETVQHDSQAVPTRTAVGSGNNDWIENTKQRLLRGRTAPQEKIPEETPDDSDIHFVMSTGNLIKFACSHLC
jgi:hypothetical protein